MGSMGTESGPKSWVVGESTQGEGVGAMISSKMGRAERCRCTNSAKACLPCCQQVRRTLPIFDACGHRWPYDCLPSFCEPSPSAGWPDRKSTRLNSSHLGISYAVFCL